MPITSVGTFLCPRCGNSDAKYIGVHKNGKPYCRRCVGFVGESVTVHEGKARNVSLKLDYALSKEQQELSDAILANFRAGIDTLVYAVTGSGKTEISYAVIAYAMSKGMKVGFSLPRRDVVIELCFRLKDAFPNSRIVSVYGGHTSKLEGDCLILTTHQLYRYPQYFDLLVLDEIDAFPFKGNETLIGLFRSALKGHCVMMSATPSKTVVKEFQKEGKAMLTLHTRFHRHPIPIPKLMMKAGPAKFVFLVKALKRYQAQKKQCFVFVPTVAMAESLFRLISPFVKNGNFVSSKRKGREAIIKGFKAKRYSFLVTTAVLERGVTVKDLQVIVYRSDNRIYDAAALIQIAGRAGRKYDAPTGEVIFLCNRITKGMVGAKKEIEYCNSFL